MSEREKDGKPGPAPAPSTSPDRRAPGRSTVQSRYGGGGAPAAPTPAGAASPPAPPTPPAAEDATDDDAPKTFDSAFDVGVSAPPPRARRDEESQRHEDERWLQNRPAPGSTSHGPGPAPSAEPEGPASAEDTGEADDGDELAGPERR